MTGNHRHPFTVGDFIVRRLSDWGVERVFGYAGDGINGIIGGIQRAGNRPRFVATPHEEIAAFMATAHAKYTGVVGFGRQRQVRARSTCSTDCTMQILTISRWWLSSASSR